MPLARILRGALIEARHGDWLNIAQVTQFSGDPVLGGSCFIRLRSYQGGEFLMAILN